jgi:hypothetical protein
LLEAAGKSGEAKSRKSYGGETYDSVDNLAKFFSKRGLPFDPAKDSGAQPGAAPRTSPQSAPGQKSAAQTAGAQAAAARGTRAPQREAPQGFPPRRPQQQTLLGMGPEPARTPPPAFRVPNTAYPPRATARPTARPTPPATPRFATRPVARGPFRPGTKVRHAKFGVGTVMRLEGEGENQKLSINFAGYGMKKVVLKYAGLQRA